MTGTIIPITGTRVLSDTEALNRIAIFMGSHEEWSGADVCDVVARIVGETGRPQVGDQSPRDLAMYRKWADRLGWEHDGEAEDDTDEEAEPT